MKHYHHPGKFSHTPFRAATALTVPPHPFSYPALEFHIGGMHCVVELLSSSGCLRLTHAVCITSLFPFIAEFYHMVGVDIILFAHFLIDGHLV